VLPTECKGEYRPRAQQKHGRMQTYNALIFFIDYTCRSIEIYLERAG